MDPSEADDILFHASFDLHHGLFSYSVGDSETSDLLNAISDLFGGYYAFHSDTSSCQQFWDNLLGYAAELPMTSFLDQALTVLSAILSRPEVHLRASALHGLNHHPDMERSRRLIEEHLEGEGDPELRSYAQDVLSAFDNGRRLV